MQLPRKMACRRQVPCPGLMLALAGLGAGGELDADYALTTVTHATLGERTVGVAPGQAELWVTLRTVSDARMERLMAEAESLVAETAKVEGLALEISYDEVFDACVNDPEADTVLAKACADQDVACMLVDQPQRFSEDFGQFGKSAKAAMFWLGAGQDHPQLHNPDYDFPDALIPIGTAIFLSAIDIVLHKNLLDAIHLIDQITNDSNGFYNCLRIIRYRENFIIYPDIALAGSQRLKLPVSEVVNVIETQIIGQLLATRISFDLTGRNSFAV